MGWRGLPDIREVQPAGEQDRAIMAEIRRVLEKHGALERFGLTLLHSHFPLADDEVLVESVDADRRRITIRPVSMEAIPSDAEPMATAWRLDGRDGEPQEVQQCFRTKSGIHMLFTDEGERV